MRTDDCYRGSVNGTNNARMGGLWQRDVRHMAQANDKCVYGRLRREQKAAPQRPVQIFQTVSCRGIGLALWQMV